MCATGPYEGEILRPSDKKHPHKIAWIQCVGSRQVTPGGNSYCSSVCCTYTQKQVILTKDHDADVECTIFHNDIRAYGKDFERFYQRAENLPGVRFIRSYVSIGQGDPGKQERHDTICHRRRRRKGRRIRSGGIVRRIESPGCVCGSGEQVRHRAQFARLLQDQSAQSHGDLPGRGSFVSGAFQGPHRHSRVGCAASGAGSQCGELLDYRRGKLAKERVYPLEKDVSKEEPRIGVFVCHCGANIGRVVNVPSTVEYALTLPNVVYAQEQLFSCASNCAKEITDITKEKGLNRVVVAACSPRTQEPLFRDTLREAGINQYYFEMANIREHCSWVHSKEKEEATQKAKDIVRMSVARACHLEPLQEFDLPVNKAALVVGGGLAGMTCALSIANQGHEVHLVEKDTDLGGMARKIHYTLDGRDVQAYLHDLIRKAYQHPLVHVYTDATIMEAAGYVGNFATKVKQKEGSQRSSTVQPSLLPVPMNIGRPNTFMAKTTG